VTSDGKMACEKKNPERLEQGIILLNSTIENSRFLTQRPTYSSI